MALPTNVQDPSTGTAQKVNTSGDAYATSAKATAYLAGETARPNDVPHAVLYCEKDSGSISGTRYLASPTVTEDEALSISHSTRLFDYSFNATAQDTANWYHAFTTMTMTQSAGFLNCNANSTNTITTGCYLSSKRYFPLSGDGALHVEMTGQISSAPLTGEVFTAGLGIPASATAGATDGVWFELTSSGLVGVLYNNGTQTRTGTLMNAGSITVNKNAKYSINIHDRATEFWLNGIFLGEITTPDGQAQPFLTDALPLTFQYYNNAAVTGTAMIVRIGNCHVSMTDSLLNKTYGAIQKSCGLDPHQGLSGGTMGTTVGNGGNSVAVPAGTAGSNTAANVTGFGGFGSMTAPAGGATDYILCSYQNPAGSVTQTPRTIYITGVNASFINNGAAVATTPTTLMVGIAYGHTAVSLATAETGSFITASTKAPRRRWLDVAYAPIGAVVGQPYDRSLHNDFKEPIVVNPGEFIAAIIKVPVGTATASQTILWSIDFEGFAE